MTTSQTSNTSEHTGRGRLNPHELAARVAVDTPGGAYVNLGGRRSRDRLALAARRGRPWPSALH
jgi:hypothetical protein